MLKLILFLWIAGYITGIIKQAQLLLQHKKCLKYLSEYYAAYITESECFRHPREEYAAELNTLLKYAPLIQEIASYPLLKYDDSDEETFQKSYKLMCELQMQTNEMRIEFFRSFLPFKSAKELILLPVDIGKTLGFELQKTTAVSLTIFSQLLLYILDMFQPEIKNFLILTFEYFTKG